MSPHLGFRMKGLRYRSTEMHEDKNPSRIKWRPCPRKLLLPDIQCIVSMHLCDGLRHHELGGGDLGRALQDSTNLPGTNNVREASEARANREHQPLPSRRASIYVPTGFSAKPQLHKNASSRICFSTYVPYAVMESNIEHNSNVST